MSDNFRCVAIETATEHGSVAAANGDDVVLIELGSSRESSRQIYQSITAALSEVSVSLEQLVCIAFGCGPGNFTGLRVAAGAAQALAYARSLPVCRISTLAALARAAADKYQLAHVAACLDARMGEAYLGIYDCTSGDTARPMQADRLLAPAEIALEAVPGGLLAAGAGWGLWPDIVSCNTDRIATIDPNIWPKADGVLKLARHEYQVGNTVAAHAAIPNYIRDQVTT